MRNYRFKLEEYKGTNSKHKCPNPNCKNKDFTRYVDTITGEYVNENVGMCNNFISCGYHYPPKQYFLDNNIKINHENYINKYKNKMVNLPQIDNEISFIEKKYLLDSLGNYEKNNFIKFLYKLVGVEATNQVLTKYKIGTSGHWNGATVFWQIDINNIIRTGNIMLYDTNSGKRIKKPKDLIYWIHKKFPHKNFRLKQCLFGEHLLKDNTKVVAVVESAKTAIIASIFFPEYIWVATGGIQNLNDKLLKVLEGRKVILFPDANAINEWKLKSSKLETKINFHISDFIENIFLRQDKKSGYDLADYIIENIENFKTHIK